MTHIVLVVSLVSLPQGSMGERDGCIKGGIMIEYLHILPNLLQFLMAWPIIVFIYAWSDKRRAYPVPGLVIAVAVLWFVGISLPLWIMNLPAFLIWKLFRKRRTTQK